MSWRVVSALSASITRRSIALLNVTIVATKLWLLSVMSMKSTSLCAGQYGGGPALGGPGCAPGPPVPSDGGDG
eukprot:scaffold21456_cov23-Prasinocladus_malaysianus.AAC.1